MSKIINVKTHPLPYRIESKLGKLLSNVQGYEALSTRNLKRVKKLIDKFQIKYKDILHGIKLSIDQALSIRSAYLKKKLMQNYYRLDKYKSSIIKSYNKRYRSMLYIANKYELSPLTIFRFLVKQKYTKKQIQRIKSEPERVLDERDYREFRQALKCDIVAPYDQDRVLEYSLEFENKVESFLISHNIKYKTQEQLVIEQKKKYGRAINTPDFLILDDLKINNKEVKWIDAKNFFGANTFLVKKSIVKQTKKYLDQWGNGCIIFSLGYSENILKDSSRILLLDFSRIV